MFAGKDGEQFGAKLSRIDAIDNRLKDYIGKYFWGKVILVANGELLVDNGNKNGDGGNIYVSNYPDAQQVLEDGIVFAPALWVGNRDGKRVFDCGTIANIDDVLKLPIKKVE